MKRKKDTLSDLLRAAIAKGPSHAELERQTGVQRASIMRFIRGEQTLRLDKAEALCEYFGIESRVKGRK